MVHGCTEGLFGHQERRASSRFSRGDRTILDCNQDLFGYEERKAGSRHLDCIQGLFGYKKRRAGLMMSSKVVRLPGATAAMNLTERGSEGASEPKPERSRVRTLGPTMELERFASMVGLSGT